MSKINAIEKMPYETAKVEIINFETKTDIVCASKIVGEEDEF